MSNTCGEEKEIKSYFWMKQDTLLKTNNAVISSYIYRVVFLLELYLSVEFSAVLCAGP